MSEGFACVLGLGLCVGCHRVKRRRNEWGVCAKCAKDPRARSVRIGRMEWVGLLPPENAPDGTIWTQRSGVTR